jgi:hypothetical protein
MGLITGSEQRCQVPKIGGVNISNDPSQLIFAFHWILHNPTFDLDLGLFHPLDAVRMATLSPICYNTPALFLRAICLRMLTTVA